MAKAIAYASGFTVVAGTPGYMAPEQTRPGGGLDVRADVHAIGAMAYQMLTSRPPERDAPAAPSKLRAGVSREVDRIVLKALAPERERRWPTAAALADALDEAIAAPARTRNRLVQATGRTAGVLVAAAGLVLLGGAVPGGAAPAGWVRVADATGRISVAVPPAWAGQVRDAGWDPATIGLPGGHRPGLSVAADLTSWGSEYTGAPGLFAGAATGTGDAGLPVHAACTRAPGRPIANGRIIRWTRCADTSISYSEVVLGDLYLQIKQTGDDDLTAEILATVHS